MAVIGELIVNVGATVGQAVTELNKFRGSVQSIGGSIGKSLGAINGLGAALTGIGVTLSAGAIVGSIKAQASAIDALADSSKRLNSSYAGLATLQHAAQMTGTEFGALEGSLGKMQKNLAEVADTGKGGAADALGELGLSAKRLAEMKTDDAFGAIAARLADVQSESTQARLAVELFGKSGQSILNTVNLGADGLAQMRTEAEKLGLTLDDLTADHVGKLNDELDRLHTAMGGLKTQILINLGPGVADTIQGFTDVLSGGRNTAPGQSIEGNTGWWKFAERAANVGTFGGTGWLAARANASGVLGETPENIRRDQEARGVWAPFNSAERSATQASIAGEDAKTRGVAGLGRLMAKGFKDVIMPNLANAKDIGGSAASGLLGGAIAARQAANEFYLWGAAGGGRPGTPAAAAAGGGAGVGLNRAVMAGTQEGFLALAANQRGQTEVQKLVENTDQTVEFLKVIANNSEAWQSDPLFSIAGDT